MAQYIDKSAVVAEIDDWRDKIKKGIFSIPLSGNERAYATFEYEVLGKVISFLDTFEVKDMDEIVEDVKDTTMRDFAWKVHTMISEGKSVSEIDHYVCGVCDF